MPNRINTYIQEIITYSVRENQDFLQQALNSSRILQYMLVIIVGLIFMISMYVAIKYSRYLERLISNILELTKRIATGIDSKEQQQQTFTHRTVSLHSKDQ